MGAPGVTVVVGLTPAGPTLVAFLSAYLQLRWGFRRLDLGDEEDASAIVLAAGIGGILGAKLYYAALYGDWRLLLGRFGLVWYGGFILGVIAVVWVESSIFKFETTSISISNSCPEASRF